MAGREDGRELLQKQPSTTRNLMNAAVAALPGLSPEEVNAMYACLSRPIGSSQPFGEQITVSLIPAVSGDLRRLRKQTNMSTTDLANRAITSYSFFEAQLRAGHDLIVRYSGTGEAKFVRFL